MIGCANRGNCKCVDNKCTIQEENINTINIKTDEEAIAFAKNDTIFMGYVNDAKINYSYTNITFDAGLHPDKNNNSLWTIMARQNMPLFIIQFYPNGTILSRGMLA